MQAETMSYGKFFIPEWTDQLNLRPGLRKTFECLVLAARGQERAWPEQEWLAAKANITTRTVRSHTRALEKKGVVKTVMERINGQLRLVYYFLAHPVAVAARDRKNFPVTEEKFSGHLNKRKKNIKSPPTPPQGEAAGAAEERENEKAQTQKGSAAEDRQFRTTGNLPRDNAALPDAVPGDAGGEQGSFLGLDQSSPSNRSLAGHGTAGVGRVLLRVQPTENPALSGNVGGDGVSQPDRTPNALSYRQAKRRSRCFVSEIDQYLCQPGRGDNNAGQFDRGHFRGLPTASNALRGVSKAMGDAELSSPEKSERAVGTRRTGDAGYACLPAPSRANPTTRCDQRGSETATGSTQEKRFAPCSSDKNGEWQGVHVPTSAHGRSCGATGFQRLGQRTLGGIFPADEPNDVALSAESPAWQAACTHLQQKLSENDFELWIKPIQATETNAGLRLDCQDRFHLADVQGRFGTDIRDAMQLTGNTEFYFSFGEKEREIQEENERKKQIRAAQLVLQQRQALQKMSVEEQFTVLFDNYPPHRRSSSDKQPAFMFFQKALKQGETSIFNLLTALKRQRASERWQKDQGRWVPGIKKWFEERRWEESVQ